MSASQSGVFSLQEFTDVGAPLVAGRLYTYTQGTTTHKTAYTDKAGSIAHTYTSDGVGGQYIGLNARGELPAPLYLAAGSYDITLKDSTGATIWTRRADPVDDSAAALDSAIRSDLASTSGASKGAGMVGFIQSGAGAVATTVRNKLREFVSVKDFGAVGDGVTDDTAAIQAAVTHSVTQGKSLRIPAGTYLYSSLAGLDQNNVTIFGDGSNNTVLKYTGTGDALVFGTAAGFRQGINISGITVEGNANVDRIIVAKALARCQWTDINVREAKSASGIGFVFQGCMLNRFDSLVCSTDRQAMTNPPYEAFNIEALSPYGNCSNNTFTNLYAEGNGNVASTIEIGIRISGGDQNTFIGGSPESCGTWGLLLDTDCRYNTFIGMGFENLAAVGGDVADAGISNRFINCYSSEKIVLQGRSASVEGGYFERIQIDIGATKNRVQDVLINGWSTGAGGFVDNGTCTEWKNVYDEDSGAFIYPLKDRVGLNFTAFPQAWVNNTGQYVEVVMNGATISGVSLTRNGLSWDLTAGNGPFLVAPTDTITFAGSGIPTKFWAIPHNGFQG